MQKDNWDDLRFILAVADNGSVGAAARALGVNHVTVLRRIAGFEERNGIKVFDRGPRGYLLPPDRARVTEAIREVETAIHGVSRAVQGLAAPLSGPLRITSTDSLCLSVLPGIVRDITRRSPDLSISVICANAHLDFARLSADITVRPAPTMPEGMFGQRAGELGFGAYVARDHRAETWLELQGVLSDSIPGRWAAIAVADMIGNAGADSFLVLREMAARGLGIAILPQILGQDDPRLTLLPDRLPPLSVPIWVASHQDLEATPRIRSGQKLLIAGLQAMADRLSGTEPGTPGPA